MKYFVPFAALISGTAAFSALPFGVVVRTTTTTSVIQSSTALCYFPDNYDRAIECATHYGQCHVDELEQLVDELDDFQHDEFKGSCFFEKNLEACEKDWQDMNHVKQILKVQTKLHQMTDDYVHERHQPETYDLADIF